jgi:hypothetical protein
VSTFGKFIVASLVIVCACHRQTGPDANYEKASTLYQQLYASELDDAYGDAKMNEVVQLLEQVDKRSVDARAAEHLLENIKTGREALAKQRAERERMGRAAAKSFANQTSIDPSAILAANAPPDAGVVDPYGAGAPVADINAATGGCLQDGEPFREQVTNKTGTVYRVSKSERCNEKLPGFAGQVVLVVDGKIYRRVSDPTPNKEPVPIAKPDAGTVAAAAPAAPNAGVAPAAPSPAAKTAPAAPAQAGAAAGQSSPVAGGSVMITPGAPLPEGVTLAPPAPAQNDSSQQ